ncbi:MAG: tail fiber assembly protein [Betaproteobacteria bacterium]
MPRIYHYHPETGEYLGESEARESPLEPGVFLLPAHATFEAPPEAGPGQVAVFNAGVWHLMDAALFDQAQPSPEQPMTTEQAWAALRAERNARLAACDWTQLPDVPLTVDQKAAWAQYRQKLRDLPADTTDPCNPVWPEPPA